MDIAHVLNYLVGLSRRTKTAVQMAADAIVIALSVVLALALRLDNWAFMEVPGLWLTIMLTVGISLPIFVNANIYSSVMRYVVWRGVQRLPVVALISAACLFIMARLADYALPRSVPFLYALLLFIGMYLVRSAAQSVLRSLADTPDAERQKVVIYGAGSSGRQLVQSLNSNTRYLPVAFVDRAPDLIGMQVAGLPVYGPDKVETLVDNLSPKLVLLAIPSATKQERAKILARLESLPVKVQSIPGLLELVSGTAQIGDFVEVAVEDLLGRDPVPAIPALLSADISGRVVLVTGAGGSIGSELCRQIAEQAPAKLVLFDISEIALYTIHRELVELSAQRGYLFPVIPVIGSVQNASRVLQTYQRHAVQTVYHAAAYKHVPLVEENPMEGLRNNVWGTLTVVNQAVAAGVDALIMISTDKAVRPTNVMGASKRLAELICQAKAEQGGSLRISMVRFGNVLGSSGSVIPLFRKQIADGGPVTVTHPDIIRYFMTIPEAAQLVIQSGAMARGGDVFLLDMGEPVRIVDLAQRMIRLSGFEPALPDSGKPVQDGIHIAIRFTGLRPGEKLFEELLIDDDDTPTAHPKIIAANEQLLRWSVLEPRLNELDALIKAQDINRVRQMLMALPLGYHQPSNKPVAPVPPLALVGGYPALPTTDPSHRPIKSAGVN